MLLTSSSLHVEGFRSIATEASSGEEEDEEDEEEAGALAPSGEEDEDEEGRHKLTRKSASRT
jgi:hypothetical protein